MARLVDTSVLVQLERRAAPIAVLADDVLGQPAAVSTIAIAEMLFGMHRADTQARRDVRLSFIETIIDGLTVVPFDLDSARVYASLWSDLMARGNMIGTHDLQIASTALAHDYAVLTLNVRDFERVPGLTVVQPSW